MCADQYCKRSYIESRYQPLPPVYIEFQRDEPRILKRSSSFGGYIPYLQGGHIDYVALGQEGKSKSQEKIGASTTLGVPKCCKRRLSKEQRAKQVLKLSRLLPTSSDSTRVVSVEESGQREMLTKQQVTVVSSSNVVQTALVKPDQREVLTTLVIENLSDVTQTALVRKLDQCGLRDAYNFVQIPCCFNTGRTMGFALINFVEPGMAALFIEKWHQRGGVHFGNSKEKPLRIAFAEVQGLERSLQRWAELCLRHIENPDFLPFVRFDLKQCVNFQDSVTYHAGDPSLQLSESNPMGLAGKNRVGLRTVGSVSNQINSRKESHVMFPEKKYLTERDGLICGRRIISNSHQYYAEDLSLQLTERDGSICGRRIVSNSHQYHVKDLNLQLSESNSMGLAGKNRVNLRTVGSVSSQINSRKESHVMFPEKKYLTEWDGSICGRRIVSNSHQYISSQESHVAFPRNEGNVGDLISGPQKTTASDTSIQLSGLRA